MKNKAKKSLSLWFPLTIGIAILCGCQANKPSVPASKKEAITHVNLRTVSEKDSPGKQQETAQLTLCQKELEALKDINPGQHKDLQRVFDQLMNGAAQYAGLRGQVNAETQQTVDALYHYKVKRLCASIAQTTLNGLVERGEQQK